MANSVTMTYGSYSFSPVPLISIQRESLQVRSREEPIGFTFTMTLNGTLTPLPGTTGLPELDTLIEELRSAFNRDGKLLEIECDGSPVMCIYPRIKNIQFDEGNNNWVQTVPYTIEIEYDNDDLNEHPSGEVPPYIEEFTEEWQVEFVEDNKYYNWDLSTVTDQRVGHDYVDDFNHLWGARVTHNMSARGKQSWVGDCTALTGTSTNGADNAMNWLRDTFAGFGYDAENYGHAISGWTNLLPSVSPHDHFRSHTINETDGTANLVETWVLHGGSSFPSGTTHAVEEFTIEVRQNTDDGKVHVGVNGHLHGLEIMDYSNPDSSGFVSATAYTAASDKWGEVQNRVFPRAQFIYQQDFSRQLNPGHLSKVVGHSPTAGTIDYSYEFDDRPCAFITGALSETFNISDNHPTDVFASLAVLGRPQGPVLQEISTVTEASREVTIEVVMAPPTGCSSITDLDLNKPTVNVANILCEFETQLTDANNQVFKNTDTESWNPLTGHYTRTAGWTYQNCSGSGTGTSFC